MTKPKYPRWGKSAPVYDRAVAAFERAHGYEYRPHSKVEHQKWLIGWQAGYAAGARAATKKLKDRPPLIQVLYRTRGKHR